MILALGAVVPAEDQTWKAPPEEAARKNPLPDTSENRAKGRDLYRKHCAMCHGDEGKGDGPAGKFNPLPPRDLTDPALQARLTDGEILWKLTEGRQQEDQPVMPGMRATIPREEDRWTLVMHVRTLGNRAGED